MTTQSQQFADLDLLGAIFEAAEDQPPSIYSVEISEVDLSYYSPTVRNAHLDELESLELIGLVYEFSTGQGPVKFLSTPKFKELIEKIKQSGGWKLVVERWGLDKIVVGMTIKEFIEFLMALPW